MSCCSRLTAFRQKLNCGIGIPKRTFSNTGTFGSLHRKPCPATPPRATKDDRTKTHTSLRGSVIPHCSPRDCVVDMADGLVTRELEAGDFHKGFLKLLSALTTVGDISEDAFKGRVAITTAALSTTPLTHVLPPSSIPCACFVNGSVPEDPTHSPDGSASLHAPARFDELKSRAPDYRISVIEGTVDEYLQEGLFLRQWAAFAWYRIIP